MSITLTWIGHATWLVDTGFSAETARQRGRDFLRCPAAGLTQMGIDPDSVSDVIISHTYRPAPCSAQSWRKAAFVTPAVNAAAPAYGKRDAVIFATCFANYNNPAIGEAALKVLAKNGVRTEVVYPGCCGMPQLEQGDIARVAEKARSTAQALKPYVQAGKDIVALVPSCALMGREATSSGI